MFVADRAMDILVAKCTFMTALRYNLAELLALQEVAILLFLIPSRI